MDPEIVKEERDSETVEICSNSCNKSIESEPLLLDLFSILRTLDSANDNTFGFSVASKATPRMRDSPWIESVQSESPAFSKLQAGQHIISINDIYVAGMSAKEVRRHVQECGLKMRLRVKSAGSALTEEICLWRGRLGLLRDFAQRWCCRATNTAAGIGCPASCAAREVRRALQAFLELVEGLDLAEMRDALHCRASKCQGAWPPPLLIRCYAHVLF